MKSSTFIKQNVIVIMVLVLAFVSLAVGLRGITRQFEVWDEITVVRYGEEYLNFWKSGDFSNDSWKLNKEHPPFSKYFYGASRLVSLKVPLFRDKLDQEYAIGKRYTFQRMLSVFVGMMSVIFLFFLTKKFYGLKKAFLAGLILIFIPYFMAHTRAATQENLVGFLTLASTTFFFFGLKTNNLKSKYFLLSGVLLGFAIATKYNALFFMLLFGLLTIINFGKEFIKNPKKIINNYIILIPIIAFIILFIIWPWLWSDPIGNFLASLNSRVGVTRFDQFATEYFLGVYPHHNPFYYFVTYFVATTPPILLFSLGFFVIKLLVNRNKYDLWFFLYFLTPFLASFSPLKIDGIRYIFPVYPALAICSAIGIYWFFSLIVSPVKNKTISNFGTKYAPYLVLIPIIYTSISFFPYMWDYYNVLVGGPKNVYNKRLFDYGYWGEGSRKAINFLNSNAEKESDVWLRSFVPDHVIPQLRADLKNEVQPGKIPDYIILNPTGEWLSYPDFLKYYPEKYERIYLDEFKDTPMVQIFKRIGDKNI